MYHAAVGRIQNARLGILPYRLLRWLAPPSWLHWLGARLVNQNFLLGVLGIIEDDSGRVLLFSHTYRRLAWGFPGGWMVRGESPFAALEREVREESGLQIEARELLLVGTNTDRAKMEFVVRARVVGGAFRPSAEVDALRWFSLDEIPVTPRLQPILERARRRGPEPVGFYTLTWRDERAADRP